MSETTKNTETYSEGLKAKEILVWQPSCEDPKAIRGPIGGFAAVVKTLALGMFMAMGCFGQSLTFTTSDARCTPSGGTINCTLTQYEQGVQDYGINVSATVSGTWTLQTVTSSCSNGQSGYVLDAGQIVTTSLTANGTIYLTPTFMVGGLPQGQYNLYQCAAGTYTYNFDFLNGSTHVLIGMTQIVKLRPAAPIIFDGFGTADYLRVGWSLNPIPNPVGYTYYQNDAACNPACFPFSAYTPPANVGNTFTDEAGNVVTVLTPRGAGDNSYTYNNSSKTPINGNNTLLLVSNATGNEFIFDATGSGGNSPLYTIPAADYNSADTYCWSADVGKPTTLYVMKTAVYGGANVFKKLVFTTPPTPTTTVMYTLPAATYGRMSATSANHQDCTRLDWQPALMLKDYGTVVNIVNNTITRVSGDNFTAAFNSQNPNNNASITISAVNVGAQVLTTSGPVGDCTGCTVTFSIPTSAGAFHLPSMDALGALYIPTLTDISGTNLPFPLNNFTVGNGGPVMAYNIDTVDGKYYMYGGNSNGPSYETYMMSFRPNIDFTPTLTTGIVAPGNPINRTCNASAAGYIHGAIGANDPNRCTTPTHMSSFITASGESNYIVQGVTNGTEQNIYNAKTSATNPNYNNVFALLYEYYLGAEYGSARGTNNLIAPYFVTSTNDGRTYTDYGLVSCTTATPTVCTLGAAPAFVSGDSVLVGGAVGCTTLNGIVTAATVSGTTVTFSVGCATPYAANSARVTKSVAYPFTGRDNDLMYVCRNKGLASACNVIGHSRSSVFVPTASSYYDLPRTALSNDGTKAIYTTSFGIPGNLQVMMVNLPHNCLGVQDNAFDCAGNTVSVSGNVVSYSTPTTEPTIVEIGQSTRHTDGFVGTTQTGACGTFGRTVLNLTDLKRYTCGATNWSEFTPDSTYKVDYNTVVNFNRSSVFSGLTPSATYYYRVIVGQKFIATGSFVAGASTATGSRSVGVRLNGATVK